MNLFIPHQNLEIAKLTLLPRTILLCSTYKLKLVEQGKDELREEDMQANFELNCSFCHEKDLEVIVNDRYGFMLMCNECGYTETAHADQLVASR